jgi:hypothetical protein
MGIAPTGIKPLTQVSPNPHDVIRPHRIGSAPSSLFDRVGANLCGWGRIAWDKKGVGDEERARGYNPERFWQRNLMRLVTT